MKRRRKNKSGRSFYMVMSILCLTALFLGYSFVYNLSEERKTGKDITTISIKYNASGKEDDLSTFDRVMSYFNIFLEKTFKEKKSDDVDIIENIEPQSHKNEFFKTIARKIPMNLKLMVKSTWQMIKKRVFLKLFRQHQEALQAEENYF